MAQNWAALTATELGRMIGAGQLDPVELAEYFLGRIQDPRIYARTTAPRALAEAEAARLRAKSGHRRSALDGVPISWKDLFDSAGVATEAGSALLADRIPARDATVLANATRQGLVCLGKTHMSELAFSGLGLNPITATPPCVNDPLAVAGGSSSGAAASVAFGVAAAAIGSDTGGSIRVPAAWNDLVGLKTSHGLLALTGTVPLCLRFDTIGPIARSVSDCALLLAALQGQAAGDLNAMPLQGARLLVMGGMQDLRAEPAAGFEFALERLSQAGAVIHHRPLAMIDRALDLAGLLFTPEAWAIWQSVIESAPDKMFPPILDRFRSGAGILAKDYIAAWAELDRIRAEFAKVTADYHAVILPTSAILPPNAQRLLDDHAYFARENLLALRNTRIGNLLDQCVITLPTNQPSCGLSVMMGPGSEGRLLRLCLSVESALAQHIRH